MKQNQYHLTDVYLSGCPHVPIPCKTGGTSMSVTICLNKWQNGYLKISGFFSTL